MRKKNMKLAVTSVVLSACVAVQPVAACAAEGANLADENTAGGGVNSGNPAEESAPQQPNEEIVEENEGIVGTPGTEGTEDQAGQESSGNYEIVEDNLQEEEAPAEPEEEAASSESQPAESAETTASAGSTEEKTYPDSEDEISAGQALNEAGDAVLEKPEGETVEEYNEKAEDYNEKVDGYNDVVTGDNDKLAEDFTGEGSADKLDDAKKPLDDAQDKVADLQAQLNALEALKNNPNPERPFSIEEYNQKVAELNAAVKEQQTAAGAYNDAVDKIQTEKQEEVIQENQGINSDNKDVVTENEQTMNENDGKLGKTEETDQEGNVTLDVGALEDSDLKGQYEGAKKAMEDAKGTLEGLTIPQYTDEQIKNLTPEEVAEYEKVVANYNQVKADYDRKVEAYNSLADQVADELTKQNQAEADAKTQDANNIIVDQNTTAAGENKKKDASNKTETEKNNAVEDTGLTTAADELDAARDVLNSKKDALDDLGEELKNASNLGQNEYNSLLAQYKAAAVEYNGAVSNYNAKVEAYSSALTDAKKNVEEQNAKIDSNNKEEVEGKINATESNKVTFDNQTTADGVTGMTSQAAELAAKAKELHEKEQALIAAATENRLDDFVALQKEYNTLVTEYNNLADAFEDEANKKVHESNQAIVQGKLEANHGDGTNKGVVGTNQDTVESIRDKVDDTGMNSAANDLTEAKNNLEKVAGGETVTTDNGETLTLEKAEEIYNQKVGAYNDAVDAYLAGVDEYNTKKEEDTAAQNVLNINAALETNQGTVTANKEKYEDFIELANAEAALTQAEQALRDAVKDPAAFETAKQGYEKAKEDYNKAVDSYHSAQSAEVNTENEKVLDHKDTYTKNNAIDVGGTLKAQEEAVEAAKAELLTAAKDPATSAEQLSKLKDAYAQAVANYNTAVGNFNAQPSEDLNEGIDQYNQETAEKNQALKDDIQSDTAASAENNLTVLDDAKNQGVVLEDGFVEELKAQHNKVTAKKSEMENLKAEMEKLTSEDAGYQDAVKAYNEAVKAYNAEVETYAGQVKTYNEAVNSWNADREEITDSTESQGTEKGEADWGNIEGQNHLTHVDVRFDGAKTQTATKDENGNVSYSEALQGYKVTGVYTKKEDAENENRKYGVNYTQDNKKDPQGIIDMEKSYTIDGGEFRDPDQKEHLNAESLKLTFWITVKNDKGEKEILSVSLDQNDVYSEGTYYEVTEESKKAFEHYEKTNPDESGEEDKNGIPIEEIGGKKYYNLSGQSVFVVSAMTCGSFEWDEEGYPDWSEFPPQWVSEGYTGNAAGLDLILSTQTIVDIHKKDAASTLQYFTQERYANPISGQLVGLETGKENSVTQAQNTLQSLDSVTFDTLQAVEKINAALDKAGTVTVEQGDLSATVDLLTIAAAQLGTLELEAHKQAPTDVTLNQLENVNADDGYAERTQVKQTAAANLSPLGEKNLLTGFTDYTKTAEAHLNKAASQIKALFIELGGGGTTDPDPDPEIDPETDPDPDPEIDPETDPDPDPETDPDPDVEIPEGDVPLAELPTQQVPLTELPEGQTPILVELSEEQVPLTELPDEAVPMARPAKTGDTTPMLALSTALAGAALALTKLLERKRHTAKHAKR